MEAKAGSAMSPAQPFSVPLPAEFVATKLMATATTEAGEVAGSPQPAALPPWPEKLLPKTLKLRVVFAAIGVVLRVSHNRHGVTVCNTRSSKLCAAAGDTAIKA